MYQGRDDMAMIYSEVPCNAAGTFTTNLVKAAPVKWDQEIVYRAPSAQAVIINAGIANACTGAEGYGYCRATADAAADILKIPANAVLVASTGVIGMQIPIHKIVAGVQVMSGTLDGSLESGTNSARAIMTTDTKKKEITEVNPKIIYDLLEKDFLPIICPIGFDDSCLSYNINADDAACAVAKAVKAEKLAFLTDVEGLYRDFEDKNSLISEMMVDEAQEFINSGSLGGGMLPKLQNCVDAIKEAFFPWKKPGRSVCDGK